MRGASQVARRTRTFEKMRVQLELRGRNERRACRARHDLTQPRRSDRQPLERVLPTIRGETF